MSFFESVKNPKLKRIKREASTTPVGLWKKCTNCGEILQSVKLEESLNICPYCDFHFRISSKERIAILLDSGTFTPWAEHLMTKDPLLFKDKKAYKDRLEESYEKTGMRDGTICGQGEINGRTVTMAVMDFSFMGGSMGVVTGEKISMCMEKSLELNAPCIVVSCSGGARMQEGILSLMQMAKTASLRKKLKIKGVPFISVLTDPTTGGVAASFAMLGDINIAEPNSLVGFAGPRVIEQSIREVLPEGFQKAEFLLEHGFLDRIVHRKQLKQEISFFINMFNTEKIPFSKRA